MSQTLRHADYTIAWIAILPIEAEAALAALDKRHCGRFESVRGDDYTYIGGEINGHNVVIAKLPVGQNYGVGAAAALVNQVKARFENIWFALLVGVAAGLPNLSVAQIDRQRDIRLGDVLVCVPDKYSTGIIHYDLGRETDQGFETNGRQAEPPALVRAAIGDIQLTKKPYRAGNQLAVLLDEFLRSVDDSKFDYPGQDNDQLFDHRTDDQSSLPGTIAKRESRSDLEKTRVWYGRIGSGSTLMRNARRSDELRDRYDLIGLEMEAAGVMDTVPTGVVRGVCDYGDGHKTKIWQPYAAAVAAVYAKAILLEIRPRPRPRVSSSNDDTRAKNANSQSFKFGLDLIEVPVIEDDLFIGRSSQLREMESILRPEHPRPRHHRLVLGGVGGIGKTQLAIAYVKHHFRSYDSIFWLNAASEIALQRSIRQMAERVLDVNTTKELDTDELQLRITRWLSDNQNTQWLLIFDNYDEPGAFEIGKYCPYGANGSAIITTRLPDQVKGQKLLLKPLNDIDDSLSILATRSKRADVHTDPHALNLAKRMQGLPLALATAGAFLCKSTWTFERYQKEYEQRWNIHSRRTLKLQEYQDRTLYTTWDISYRRLEKEDAEAARFLKLLAYFDNQHLWFELFQTGIDDDTPDWLKNIMENAADFEDVMRLLTDYCFVELQLSTKSYNIHACVHDYVSVGLNKQVDRDGYRYAFNCVANSILGVDRNALAYLRYAPLAPHARRLAHKRFKEDTNDNALDHLDKMMAVGQLLQQQTQLDAAKELYLWALAGYETLLGSEHILSLLTINNLGNIYMKQGKLPDAEQMYLRALDGRKRALGPDHTSTLDTVNNLGNLYKGQGKLAESEQMYLRALAGYEVAHGSDHPWTLDTVDNLGLLYASQGRQPEAEQMYRRALAGYEIALGSDHTSSLRSVNHLGMLYAKQGKLVEAEQMYHRALAGLKIALGSDHASTLWTGYNLGMIYAKQGKLVEAEQMYLRALAGRETVLGPNHMATLHTINNIGNLYVEQGRLPEAEPIFLRALAGYEKVLGPDRTSTLNVVINLGNLYIKQGKLSEAECLAQRADAGMQQAVGSDNLWTKHVLEKLGELKASLKENNSHQVP